VKGLIVQKIRLSDRALTLCRRRDVHFANKAEEQRAAESAKKFLADSFGWQHNSTLISQIQNLLGLKEVDAANARRMIKRAIETGELVTTPDAPSSGFNGSRGDDVPRPRAPACTPSQLFGRLAGVAPTIRSFAPRALPRVPADDFFAILSANPGDLLPDGTTATALDSTPFEYVPHTLSDEVMELAASTKNPKFAAKMLGYSSSQFREMVHRFKEDNTIGPADDIEWFDNGDVYFKGMFLDNFHGYKD
jgi:hypothetical protein